MKHRYPQLKIRLEPDAKAWLESKAELEERSQSWLLNHLIKEAMQNEQKAAS